MKIDLDDCTADDTWVKRIKAIFAGVQKNYEEIASVTICGEDTISVIPIQYIQASRELIIFKRDGVGLDFYKEGMKVFCYFSDAYYVTHSNYYNFINKVHQLQMKSLSSSSPKCANMLSDLMDSFVVCVMSGKYANSIKSTNVNKDALKITFQYLREGFNKFSTDPFSSLQSACIKSVLYHFLGFTEVVDLPDFQSAKIVLPRAEDLVRQAVMTTGHTAAFTIAETFFNLSSIFINSHIHNVSALR